MILINSDRFRLQATDPDAGDNGTVAYEIVYSDADSLFSINATTGRISTIRIPDRESLRKELTLTVMASDSGKPAKTAVANISVSILVS